MPLPSINLKVKRHKTIIGCCWEFFCVVFMTYIHAGVSQTSITTHSLLSVQKCPNGWDFYANGNTCFKKSEVKRLYKNTGGLCKSPDHLAIVPDLGTFEFVKARYDVVWIGAVLEDGVWKWVNGDAVTNQDQLGMTANLPNGERCGLFEESKLKYERCNHGKHFLCQTEAPVYHLMKSVTSTSSPNHQLTCPLQWKLYNGRCFSYKDMDTNKMTWDEARRHCISLGGDLAVFPDEATYTFVKGQIGSNFRWIGLTPHSEKLTWVNGQPLTMKGRDFLSISSDETGCFTIKNTQDAIKEDCQSDKRFICEKGPSSIMPIVERTECSSGGWTSHPETESCFKSYNPQKTWEKAREMCVDENADLAKIEDSSTENFIRSTDGILGHQGNRHYWVGLHKRSGETNIHWLDEAEQYDHWHKIDSDTVVASHRVCVRMTKSAGGHTDDWQVLSCDENNRPLCQKRVTVTEDYGEYNERVAGDQTIISKVRLTCPPNWKLFEAGGFCVGAFDDPRLTHADAADRCKQYSGHLAKIADSAARDFIAGHRHPTISYWVGVDASDTTLTFTNWEGGGPSGQGCVSTYPAMDTWRVEDCGVTRAFICQTEPGIEEVFLKELMLNGRPIYISSQKALPSEVQQKCEYINKTELFLTSDDEFLQLITWLDVNSHVFTEDIWMKTSKLGFSDYRWANELNRVGEDDIWSGDSTGYDCYDDYALHDCCTFVYNTRNVNNARYRLKEKLCTKDALFMCRENIDVPTPTQPATTTTSTQPTTTATSTQPTTTATSTQLTTTATSTQPTTTTTTSTQPTTTTTSSTQPTTTTTSSTQPTTTATSSSTQPTTTTTSASIPEFHVPTESPSTISSSNSITSSQSTSPSTQPTTSSTQPTTTTTSPSTTQPTTTTKSPSTTQPTATATSPTQPTTTRTSPSTTQPTATATSPTQPTTTTTTSSTQPTTTTTSSAQPTTTSSSTQPTTTTTSTAATQPTTSTISFSNSITSSQSTSWSTSGAISTSTSSPSNSAATTIPVFHVTDPPLIPMPPSKPLTPVEKQEFRESLNLLMSVFTSTPNMNTNSNGSSTADVAVVNKLCPCACLAIKMNFNPSPKDLANMINKIQESLRVETTSLSSAKNKKVSAKDDRPSSQSIAVTAVIFGSFPFIVVVSLDLIRVYQFIMRRRSMKK